MVMSLIESLTRIKNAVYGREVREAIHDGVFRANQIADGAETKSDNTQVRQDTLEVQTAQSVAQMEADKNTIVANATVDSEVILARGGKPTLQARLDETKPIKFLNSTPNTSTLPEGYIGVVPHEEVALKVLSSIPATGAENVKCHTPIFVDFNMPLDKSTITSINVRLLDGVTNIIMLRGFDSVNNRMILYPTPQLEPNKTYTLEITDGVRALQDYSIGANSKHQIVFKTGDLAIMRLNDAMNDVATNWTQTLTGTPTVSNASGYTQLKVAPSQEVILTALEGVVAQTVDFLVKPVNVQANATIHLRQGSLGHRRIISLRKTGDAVGTALDFFETNVINKQRKIDMTDYIHIKISRKDDGSVNAWVNGFEMLALKGGAQLGERIQIVVTGGLTSSEWEIHHVLASLTYEVI